MFTKPFLDKQSVLIGTYLSIPLRIWLQSGHLNLDSKEYSASEFFVAKINCQAVSRAVQLGP